MTRLRPELVAVVDRDGASLEAMLRALRGLDCRVIGFGSAPLALAQIVERPFDLVIDTRHGARIEGRSFGGALRLRMGSLCPTLVLVHAPECDPGEVRDYDAVLTTPVLALDLLAALDLTRLSRAPSRVVS